MVRNFFKSIDRSDYLKLSLLVTLYAILCASIVGFLFLYDEIDNLLSNFFHIYHNATRAEATNVVLQFAMTAIIAIPAAVLIRKLRVWLISLPIQALLNVAIIILIYRFPTIAIVIILTCGLCAQAIGVAISLGIRYLIRKAKARKQPIPA